MANVLGTNYSHQLMQPSMQWHKFPLLLTSWLGHTQAHNSVNGDYQYRKLAHQSILDTGLLLLLITYVIISKLYFSGPRTFNYRLMIEIRSYLRFLLRYKNSESQILFFKAFQTKGNFKVSFDRQHFYSIQFSFQINIVGSAFYIAGVTIKKENYFY